MTPFGELLDKMLDQKDQWVITTKRGKKFLLYRAVDYYEKLGYRNTYPDDYRAIPPWYTDALLSLEITSRYVFDVEHKVVLSLEDKEALWAKAEALYIEKGGVINEKRGFEMKCLDSTRVRNRNRLYKKILKSVMGVGQ